MTTAIERFFGVSGGSAGIRREAFAGFTTFLTMSYILFVNPDILMKAIAPEAPNIFAQLLTATALSSAFACILMGLIARYPFALAPGMGLNAFFTYSVVLGTGLSWQTALGCVFVSGIIFVLVSLAGVREAVITAIPHDLKRAVAAGIGMFLAMIGCVNSGLIVKNPVTLVQIGNLGSPDAIVCLAGLVVTGVLIARKFRGAILAGIAAASAHAIFSNAPVFGGKPFGGFTDGIMRAPVMPIDIMMGLDITGAMSIALVPVILSFFFVDFFDTAGTLVGLSEKAGFTDGRGNLPRGSRAFIVDGVATSAGALAGTTSVTTYIESVAGIEAGGRTGLTAVFTGLFFLLALFFWPLASAVPSSATAPALILVGASMMGQAAGINWTEPRHSIPCFLTIIGIPFTYSIANGIAFGIITWTIIATLTGRVRQTHWIMYLLSAVLIGKFLLAID